LDAVTVVDSRPKGDVEPLVRLAARDMATVDALILERMQSQVPVIPLLAEHLVSAGGKRLRPLLTLAAARASGATGDIGASVKLAAAVEFIHTATLLHDDVVDGSDLRRGKVAAHLIWGAPSSVLVGDFLFARAFELMVETGRMRALGILARASSVIAEGEVLQLTRAHDLNLDQDTYLRIISAKTAELFAAAAEAGAVGAGADEPSVEALRAYGLSLGLAFQLADDALDYGGTSEVLGKNAGDDFHEGKVTLPLLLAAARTHGREDAFWDRTINKGERTEDDFRRARELIVGTGSVSAHPGPRLGLRRRRPRGACAAAARRLAHGAGAAGRFRGQPRGMIVLLLIAALLQERSLAVMTPEANDRMTSEAFRANAEQAATLLSETAAEEPVELPVTGGMARMTRGFDVSGRAALLFTPRARHRLAPGQGLSGDRDQARRAGQHVARDPVVSKRARYWNDHRPALTIPTSATPRRTAGSAGNLPPARSRTSHS
jgi:octaprenyl-diphosphate synthase